MKISKKVIERSNRRFNHDFGCEERDVFRVCRMCMFQNSVRCKLCNGITHNLFVSKVKSNNDNEK